jgi:SAM-dependent methyltransferase
MIRRFIGQFARPHGLLGRLAGRLMARMNPPANRRLLDLLAPGASDRLIEVGFGPGVGIALAAERAGFVAGVEVSDVMLRQARRHNRAAIRAGRVDLRLASATEIPFPDGSFTGAFSVNSLQHWGGEKDGLRELHRVLAPEGRLALALRLRSETSSAYDRRRYGMTDERLEGVLATLRSVGFEDITVERDEVAGENVGFVLARR